MQNIRYIIEYEAGIKEKLISLPKASREAIIMAIEKKLTNDPITFGKQLRYNLKGYKRLRVGDYRVIYKINENKILVIIVDVDHRKNIY